MKNRSIPICNPLESHYLSEDLDEVMRLYKEAGFWGDAWDVSKGLLYGGSQNHQWANYLGYGLMAASMLTPVGAARGAAMLGARFAPRLAARVAARTASKGLIPRALPSVTTWTEGMNALRKSKGLGEIAASKGVVRKAAPTISSNVMNWSRNALKPYSGAGVPMSKWTGKQWAGELAKGLVGGSRSNAINWGTTGLAVGASGLTGNWDIAQARLFGPAALRGIGAWSRMGRAPTAFRNAYNNAGFIKNMPKQKSWNLMGTRNAYGQRTYKTPRTSMSSGRVPHNTPLTPPTPPTPTRTPPTPPPIPPTHPTPPAPQQSFSASTTNIPTGIPYNGPSRAELSSRFRTITPEDVAYHRMSHPSLAMQQNGINRGVIPSMGSSPYNLNYNYTPMHSY